MNRRAGALFVLLFINYGLNAASFRYLAKGNYLGVATVDFILAWWGFTMVQHIAQAETRFEQLAYSVGGVAGSLLAMWLTR